MHLELLGVSTQEFKDNSKDGVVVVIFTTKGFLRLALLLKLTSIGKVVITLSSEFVAKDSFNSPAANESTRPTLFPQEEIKMLPKISANKDINFKLLNFKP